MVDQTDDHEPTSVFGNFVTANLNADELVLEIRDIRLPHNRTMKDATFQGPVVDMPTPTPQQILTTEPIARVVLTFTAAKFLKEFLDNALPTAEKNRKA